MTGRCFIEMNSHVCEAVFAIVLDVFAYTKILVRTETLTRERMYCQSIPTVRDDRARIATCSLRTQTDRLKENYSTVCIDIYILHLCVHVEYKVYNDMDAYICCNNMPY